MPPIALFLDLEVSRAGRIMEVGAVLGAQSLRLVRPWAADWERLAGFAARATLGGEAPHARSPRPTR